MITEDYVSFEVAKLLKEKGFDEKCYCCYRKKLVDNKIVDEEELFVSAHLMLTNSKLEDKSYRDIVYCSAPTLQMAMKWLREKHKITIGILFKEDRIYYEIHQNNEFVFGIDTPKSYAKVCDEATKCCLENLI